MIGWENNQGAYFIQKLSDSVEQANDNIGTMANLTTTAKDTLVKAVNEVKSSTNTNAGNIGTMTELTTTAKDSLVNAVNEVKTRANDNVACDILTSSFHATADAVEYDCNYSQYRYILVALRYFSNINETVLVPTSYFSDTQASRSLLITNQYRNITYQIYQSGASKVTIQTNKAGTANQDGFTIYGVGKV